ncbi:MAG: phosphate ABC transporter permease subunit PstC [Planctomycetes bacterium]|nr:phosphate ABC transporter permease subunit PstC [Planctomycetota bacterium]
MRGARTEGAIERALFFCTSLSIATTLGIIAVLVYEGIGFAREVPLGSFLFGTRWAPLLEPRSYGVLPLVCGTALIVAGASLLAVPLGLAGAIYLSEQASERTRAVLKPVLEILAGIPTVVYGYFGLTFVTPLLRDAFPSTDIFNAASGAIVVGIMVLPLITSLCDEALRAVPLSIRQAAYALGATPCEVSTKVVLPGALSGVLAAVILAMSRAIGETMAVALAAGSTPKLTLNPLESIQTMTAYIVQVSLGDTPAGTIAYHTIFAVGALLFLMTLGMNLVSHRILRRYHRAYE